MLPKMSSFTISNQTYSPIPTDSKYEIFNWRQRSELWVGWPENRVKTLKERIFLN